MDKTPDWGKWMTVTMLNALLSINENGSIYDAFRPSIIKPLRDHGLVIKPRGASKVTLTEEGRRVVDEARVIIAALIQSK